MTICHILITEYNILLSSISLKLISIMGKIVSSASSGKNLYFSLWQGLYTEIRCSIRDRTVAGFGL